MKNDTSKRNSGNPPEGNTPETVPLLTATDVRNLLKEHNLPPNVNSQPVRDELPASCVADNNIHLSDTGSQPQLSLPSHEVPQLLREAGEAMRNRDSTYCDIASTIIEQLLTLPDVEPSPETDQIFVEWAGNVETLNKHPLIDAHTTSEKYAYAHYTHLCVRGQVEKALGNPKLLEHYAPQVLHTLKELYTPKPPPSSDSPQQIPRASKHYHTVFSSIVSNITNVNILNELATITPENDNFYTHALLLTNQVLPQPLRTRIVKRHFTHVTQNIMRTERARTVAEAFLASLPETPNPKDLPFLETIEKHGLTLDEDGIPIKDGLFAEGVRQGLWRNALTVETLLKVQPDGCVTKATKAVAEHAPVEELLKIPDFNVDEWWHYQVYGIAVQTTKTRIQQTDDPHIVDQFALYSLNKEIRCYAAHHPSCSPHIKTVAYLQNRHLLEWELNSSH